MVLSIQWDRLREQWLLIVGTESSFKMAYTRTSLLTLVPYSANMPPGSKGVLTKEHAVQQNLVFIHLPLLRGLLTSWKHLKKPGPTPEQKSVQLALLYDLRKKRNTTCFVFPVSFITFLEVLSCLGKKRFLLHIQINAFLLQMQTH